MAVNTTKSIRKTSNVQGVLCEKTAKNIKKLMADAGCPTYKTVKVMIPMIPGSADDVVFVGMNTVRFFFLRGQTVDMPEPLLKILQQSEII